TVLPGGAARREEYSSRTCLVLCSYHCRLRSVFCLATPRLFPYLGAESSGSVDRPRLRINGRVCSQNCLSRFRGRGGRLLSSPPSSSGTALHAHRQRHSPAVVVALHHGSRDSYLSFIRPNPKRRRCDSRCRPRQSFHRERPRRTSPNSCANGNSVAHVPSA